jgi:hypothetical protein
MKQSMIRVILAVFSWLLFTASLAAEVKVTTKTDVYILPVAELASTKTYPEVIEIESELLRVALVPNRGRVLFGLSSARTGTDFLYAERNPQPMILESGLHAVEFGGHYLSLPWNTRDRQPFDLQFEIRQSGPEAAEVYLQGKDLFVRTLTECWVRVRDGVPAVEVEMAITNTSTRRAAEVDLRDFTFFRAEGSPAVPGSVLLPAEEVQVIASEGQWLGADGARVPWPGALADWSKLAGSYRVKAARPLSFLGIRYAGMSSACLKLWEPEDFLEAAELWSWGRNYDPRKGQGPYFGVSGSRPIKLAPGEKISNKTYFVLLEEVSAETTPSSLYEMAKARLR